MVVTKIKASRTSEIQYVMTLGCCVGIPKTQVVEGFEYYLFIPTAATAYLKHSRRLTKQEKQLVIKYYKES